MQLWRARGALEARLDLLFAQPVPLAQLSLETVPELLSGAGEPAGDRRFVLLQRSADLGQGEPFAVIQAKTEALAGLEVGNNGVDALLREAHIALPIRVGRLIRQGPLRHSRVGRIQRGQASAFAHPVDVAAGDDGAKPCRQAAASVVIGQQ